VTCLIVCAAFVGGCSLDEGGASTSPDDDAGVIDGVDAPVASGDAQPAEAGPCKTPASACAGLPVGWSPVAFVENPSSSCPAGWTTRAGLDKLVAGPTACACDCTPTKPTCDGADLGTNIAPASLCILGAKTLPMASSACKSIGSTNIDNYIKVPPIARSGGACAALVKANTAALSATPVLECDPTPACQGDLCAGTAPSTFLACVEKVGEETTCPGGFPNRSLVGDAIDPQCGTGTCACGATSACSAPTLSLFSDTACSQKVLDTPADDKCNATNASGTKFQSYEYLSTPSIQCAASGAATLNPVLTTLRTVCCK